MKNERLSKREMSELIATTYGTPFHFDAFGGFAGTYYGNPLIHSQYSNDYIIFRECEYCGNNKGVDENNCCKSCGGPVE